MSDRDRIYRIFQYDHKPLYSGSIPYFVRKNIDLGKVEKCMDLPLRVDVFWYKDSVLKKWIFVFSIKEREIGADNVRRAYNLVNLDHARASRTSRRLTAPGYEDHHPEKTQNTSNWHS